jgi:hypothetical protein
MNPWDIDPNLYLPLFRTIFRSLRLSFRHLLASRARARSLRTAPPAGCRG